MQKIRNIGDDVNSADHPWALQRAVYDSIITESAAPLQRYLGSRPNCMEIAAEMLTVAAGSSTMRQRAWMRALAGQIRSRRGDHHAQD